MNVTNFLRSWRVSSGTALGVLALLGIVLSSSGCGSTLHLVKERRAQRSFEEARELGAEQYAPYEFYSAQARITEAKRQAASAEYGTAVQLSEEAEDFSRQAIELAKKARRPAEASAAKEATE